MQTHGKNQCYYCQKPLGSGAYYMVIDKQDCGEGLDTQERWKQALRYKGNSL